MGLAVLGPLRWQFEEREISREFAPSHPADFPAALKGQDQEMDDRAVRVCHGGGRMPDFGELLVFQDAGAFALLGGRFEFEAGAFRDQAPAFAPAEEGSDIGIGMNGGAGPVVANEFIEDGEDIPGGDREEGPSAPAGEEGGP